MGPNTDIDALVSVGRFREAAVAMDGLRQVTLAQRVLRVQLQSELEGSLAAAPAASSLLDERLAPLSKATCLEIIGRATGHSGDIRSGLRLFESALKLVTADVVHSARLQSRVTYAVLNWIGIEPALARLPELRRVVTKSGDAFSTIALHLICAEIEIKRDIQQRAESHLSTADALVRSFPHLVQQSKLLQLRSIQAAWESRFREALELAEASLVAAEQAGWRQGYAAAIANIAHYSLAIGDLEKARAYLEIAKDALPLPGPMGVCIRATDVDLSLAVKDIQRAHEMVQTVLTQAHELDERHAFYALWFTLSRIKFLTKSGKAGEGLRIAVDSIPYADRYADRNLRISLRLLGAEAAITVGERSAATEFIGEVMKEFELGLDHLGELHRIMGLLASSEDQSVANDHFEIAARIFQSAGLVTAARELSDDRATTRRLGSAGPTSSPESGTPTPSTVALLECWATLLDCLNSPEAFGNELLNILRIYDLSDEARLANTSIDSHMPVARGGRDHVNGSWRIEVPQQGSLSLEVLVKPKPTLAATLGIFALERAVRRMRAWRRADSTSASTSLLVADDASNEIVGMIVAAENMRELVRITQRVATSNVTVLASGETGTGKELLARALHEASPRRSKSFIPFNCTAVSRDMIDSQLFGYRRGAFTGALDHFPGIIRAASGGTLFLDEVGELPLEVQPKLLRFLESGEIHPLGEARPITVDVRVVAATNADLEQMVADGRFREDLFYRLNVVRLRVPPLRERREEIPLLVHHFVDKFSRESQRTGLRLADETIEYLVLYNWPGNVRQLANEIRRIVALTESGAVIMPEHLSHEIASSRRTIPVSERPTAPTEFVVRMDQPLSAAMQHLERAMILYALETAGDRLEDAAQMLGLSRKGLYLKRQRLKADGAQPDDDDEQPAARAR